MQARKPTCSLASTASGVLFVVVTALTAVLTTAQGAGCGDNKKSVAQPSNQTEEEGETSGDELIPAEKFDEIKSFFDRKRTVVTRCFTEAIQAGEIGKDAEGYVTVKMTIAESGALKNVDIADTSLESARLRECMIAYVQGWTVTSLPKSLDYTYTYSFSAL